MASKQVIDRQKAARAVLSTRDTHAGALQTQLAAELSPHLKRGESLPDLAFLSQLVLRWLDAAETTMVAADLAHERELADDTAPRDIRDAAAEKLREGLIDLRHWVDVLYGPATVTQFSLVGETPTDPVALSRQGQNVVSALSTVKLPKPRRKGAELDPREYAAELSAVVATLDQSLTTVARESREAEVTLAARDAAVAEFDRRYAATTNLLSALLAAAGHQALADRLRPPAGRKRKEDPEPDPSPNPGPAPTP